MQTKGRHGYLPKSPQEKEREPTQKKNRQQAQRSLLMKIEENINRENGVYVAPLSHNTGLCAVERPTWASILSQFVGTFEPAMKNDVHC